MGRVERIAWMIDVQRGLLEAQASFVSAADLAHGGVRFEGRWVNDWHGHKHVMIEYPADTVGTIEPAVIVDEMRAAYEASCPNDRIVSAA